jgi:hypothetical protein
MATRGMRGKALAALLATMILGCSNADDGIDGPIAPGEFVAIAADVVCDDQADCCALDGYEFSAQRCRSQARAHLDERLKRGTQIYDADVGGRCARALRARPAQCGGAEEDLDPCEGVLRGQVPIGERCTDSPDCAGSPDEAVCVVSGDRNDGVCTAGWMRPTRAALGEPCSATCRVDGEQQVCIGTGDLSPSFCLVEDGLYCASDTQTCAPLIAEGSSCPREPDFPGCAAGAFCEHERCVPVRGAGGSCLVDTCVSPRECPSRSELACGPGLTCPLGDAPLCTPPQPDFSPCTSPLECESNFCDGSCNGQECTPVCRPFKHTSPEMCAFPFGDDASARALFSGTP